MAVRYTFPASLKISRDCMDLIARIFVKDAGERITIAEIKDHRWFKKTPPREIPVVESTVTDDEVEAVRQLVKQAGQKEDDPKEVDALLNEAMNDEEDMI